MFKNEQQFIEQQIHHFCVQEGIPEIPIAWKWIPFSGHWGISTSFFQSAALEARQGKKVVVAQRAQEIAEQVVRFLGNPQGFSRLEAVNGYLNLYFSTGEYAQRVVDTVLQEKDQFGKGDDKKQKVMVEFSQPNTHKAFHVGHLRNVILGDAACRLLEFSGNEVVRANYLGDIGLHVIKWLWNYQKHHTGEEPGKEKIRWLGDIYAEADKYFEGSPEVEAEVRALFARWDRRDPDVVALWKKTRQWSLEGFEQMYDRLGVRFDRYYFESEMEDSGKELVKDLIQRGIARDERPDGAVIIPFDDILGSRKIPCAGHFAFRRHLAVFDQRPAIGDHEVRRIPTRPLHLCDRCAPVALHAANL